MHFAGSPEPPAFPTTYHVSPTGSDAADGLTSGTAWLTIGKALQAATDGSGVYIHAGTYSPGTSLLLAAARTSMATFLPYPGDTVTVDARMVLGRALSSSDNGSTHVKFARFEGIDFTAGLAISWRCQDIEVAECSFTGGALYSDFHAIHVEDLCERIVIEDNNIDLARDPTVPNTGIHTSGALATPISDLTIRRNTIRVMTVGMNLRGFDECVVEDNEIMDLEFISLVSTTINDADGITAGDTTITVASTTGFAAASGGSPKMLKCQSERITYTGMTGTEFTGCTRGTSGVAAATHADGVAVTQGDDHTDCIRTFTGGTGLRVRRNFIHDCEGLGFFIKDGAVSDVDLTDNVIVRMVGGFAAFNVYDTTGIRVLNNTLDGSCTWQQSAAPSTGIVFANNICASHQASGTTPVFDYRDHNLIEGTNSFGAAANEITGPAVYVNEAGDDYDLVSAGAGVNAGTAGPVSGNAITTLDQLGRARPFGAAPDMGARERQTA